MALEETLILLGAALFAAPLTRWLKINAVLAYLLIGLAIGPSGLQWVGDPDEIHVFGELGVVFLLFAIGLDLPLERLKTMRRPMFGLGAAQMALCSGVIGGVAWSLGASATAAAMIGGALALSSTAAVLRLLVERGEAAARFGRLSVAVLLFQDLAAAPLLALPPLLAAAAEGRAGLITAIGLGLVKGAALLAAAVVGSRLLLRPLFRLIAEAKHPELFTAAALLTALGLGWATEQIGLSLALGAFVAGALLADTPYRHQLEAEIQPFRGLLLGLFFLSVGMGLDLPALASQWRLALGGAAALILGKTLLIYGLALALGVTAPTAIRVALLLAQGGEFAFVLFELSAKYGVVDEPIAQALNGAVALSIAATPFLAALGRRLADKLRAAPPQVHDEGRKLHRHVVIAGYGRAGRIIARSLTDAGLPWVALDLEVGRVLAARAAGLPVYFGDVSRPDVLSAAGAQRADLAVVAIDEPKMALAATRAFHSLAPDTPIVARARDVAHARKLESVGAALAVAEQIEASLFLAEQALLHLGEAADVAAARIDAYRADDYRRLAEEDPGGAA